MPSLFIFEKHPGQGKFQSVLFFALLLYIISLFLKSSPVVSNTLLCLIVLLALFNFPPEQYLKRIRRNKIGLGLILFFFLELISLLYSGHKTEAFEVLSLRAPIFLLPLAFCFISFTNNNRNKLLVFFALTTALASFAGFVYGVWLAISTKDKGYLYNDNISDLLLGKQAAYFSFYVGAAVLILINLLLRNDASLSKLKAFAYLAIVWLMLYDFLLASKTGLLALMLILLPLLILSFIGKKKWMEIGILTFGLISSGVILNKMFPKTFHRFQGFTQTEFHYNNNTTENHFNAAFDSTKWNSSNTRVAIWQCATEIIGEHPVFGTGLGERNHALQQKYQEKNFIYAYTTRKNSHNQYLEIAVSMGLTGLVFFTVACLLYPLYYCIRRKQILAACIIILLAVCLFTENMLDRYQGEVIIALLLPLVFSTPPYGSGGEEKFASQTNNG